MKKFPRIDDRIVEYGVRKEEPEKQINAVVAQLHCSVALLKLNWYR